MDQLQEEFNQVVDELNIETMNLLENFMRVEDIEFILNGGYNENIKS